MEGASFAELPVAAARPKSYRRWSESLADYLYRTYPLRLWKSAELRTVSRPGEDERTFRARLSQALREKKDKQVEKLRKRYAPKLARLQDRIRKAEERLAREKGQYEDQRTQTAISFGATLLGVLLGRKIGSVGNVGRATTTARSAQRAAREKGDIARAEREVERQREKLKELEEDFEEEVESVRELPGPADLELEEVPVRPRKSDISVSRLALVWTPWQRREDGTLEPLY
jgi:hypothetical protein